MTATPRVAARVTVWAVERFDADTYARCWAWLSSDEHARAKGFADEAARNRFVVTRGVLREVVGRHVGASPEDVGFVTGQHGKPRLAPGTGDLEFSAAHTDGRSLVAVTEGSPIGVDVEPADKPVSDALITRVCTPTERAFMDQLPADLRRRQFLRLWVRKEAVAKADGRGFAIGFRRMEVLTSPLPVRLPQGGADDVAIARDLDVGQEHVAALASVGTAVPAVRLRRWEPPPAEAGSAST